MSYRVYAEHIAPIGTVEGAAGVDTVLPVPGIEGLRLTIPQLVISCGETAQTLTILQVEELDKVVEFDGSGETVTLEVVEDDLADRHVAIEKEDGTYFFTTVASSSAKVHTLSEAPPEDTRVGGRVFIFCASGSELAQTAALAADTENELEAPAPGRFIARDFCFPLIIHITNTTNPATLRGGAAVYISR